MKINTILSSMIEGILVRIEVWHQSEVDRVVKVEGKLFCVELIPIFANNSSLVASVNSYDSHLVWDAASFDHHNPFLTLTQLEEHTTLPHLPEVVILLEPFLHIRALMLFLTKVVVLLQSVLYIKNRVPLHPFLSSMTHYLAHVQFHLHPTILRLTLLNQLSHLQLLKRLLEPVSPPTNF